MRTITKTELRQIADHLIQKPFKYEEVFQEVLDHYATAYEESDKKLTEVFEELDQEFLNSRIVKMNEQFPIELKSKLINSHLTIFTNYFKWPQILSSIFIIVFFGLAAPYIHEISWIKYTIMYSVLAVPFLTWMYFGIKRLYKRKYWTLVNSHFGYLSFIVMVAALYEQFCEIWFEKISGGTKILELTPLVTAITLLVGFIFLNTAMKVIFTKIRPAIN